MATKHRSTTFEFHVDDDDDCSAPSCPRGHGMWARTATTTRSGTCSLVLWFQNRCLLVSVAHTVVAEDPSVNAVYQASLHCLWPGLDPHPFSCETVGRVTMPNNAVWTVHSFPLHPTLLRPAMLDTSLDLCAFDILKVDAQVNVQSPLDALQRLAACPIRTCDSVLLSVWTAKAIQER